jgi:hypothetical protein
LAQVIRRIGERDLDVVNDAVEDRSPHDGRWGEEC